MPLVAVPGRFLTRLHSAADPTERLRIERVLASARVFLTCAALLAVYLDPTEPTRYEALAYAILAAYASYSVGIWALLRRRELPWSAYWFHVVDVLFPATFLLFTAGPNSPFFLFFVFTLTAAAFRWGFYETFATAITIVLVLSAEAALLSYGPRGWLEGSFEVNRFIIRISYMLALGLLVGYLGEEEKQWRAESDTVNRLLGRVRVEIGLRGSMQALMGEYLRIFSARRALVVFRQASTGRVFVWSSDALAGGTNDVTTVEAAPDDRARYIAPLPAHTFFARLRDDGHWATWAVTAGGSRTRPATRFDPGSIHDAAGARSVLAMSFTIGSEWSGHLLLLDAITGSEKHRELRLAQNLLRHVAPACYTVYLLRRMRMRAGAMERARVARELHDGAIQALIAVEMEVDVLRRQSAVGSITGLAEGLQRVQEMLREQVFDLRTLMQQMRPVELSPAQLLDYLADMVDRFRRDTGIQAHFVSGLEEADVPPRLCREIVRMVQEALANIRKHSGARQALVRFASDGAEWKLTFQDDGSGLDFSGSMDLAELDSARRGPSVIKERVRILGGQMRINSEPGHGTYIEITLPQKAHIAYV